MYASNDCHCRRRLGKRSTLWMNSFNATAAIPSRRPWVLRHLCFTGDLFKVCLKRWWWWQSLLGGNSVMAQICSVKYVLSAWRSGMSLSTRFALVILLCDSKWPFGESWKIVAHWLLDWYLQLFLKARASFRTSGCLSWDVCISVPFYHSSLPTYRPGL